MSLLLSPPRSLGGCLQTFSEYRASERSQTHLCGTSSSGELLEYETLALRLLPPAVEVCNISDPDRTLITIASANRSGTLVEVVQGLTELGLDVHRARISSDGGWFVDVFEITEANGEKVHDPQKLAYIQQMLDVHNEQREYLGSSGEEQQPFAAETTVFELAGQDKAGLLADVTDLLSANDCTVRSAAVWTQEGRVAFVLSVTEKELPVTEEKLGGFSKMLMRIMDAGGEGIVRTWTIKGEVHHDRRLHQLMLLEASKEWARCVKARGLNLSANRSIKADERDASEQRRVSCDSHARTASSPTDSVSSLHDSLLHDFRSPKHSMPIVTISMCSDRNYWLVNIECKDRNKLLFDTVCTLADLNYDVFHATIDSVNGRAVQEYYVRSRQGCTEWNEQRAMKLKDMLEASIQRRFPKGLKVRVRSLEQHGCLRDLAQRLRSANLSITRAKVKPYCKLTSGQTLYLMAADGSKPDSRVVEEACRTMGGKLVEKVESGAHSLQDSCMGEHRFSFSVMERQWRSNWGMAADSPASSVASL